MGVSEDGFELQFYVFLVGVFGYVKVEVEVGVFFLSGEVYEVQGEEI